MNIVIGGANGPEVEAGGGTSLHDVSGWFPTKEFWIPSGTEYSDEVFIRKDGKQKSCPSNPSLKGYHYQLEQRTWMTVAAFKGALDASDSIPVRRALVPEISNQTLIIAIQAVAAEIRALREAVISGDAEPEEHQLLEDRMEAAEDLERAYEHAARTVLNLPPYDELVGN